MRYKDFIHKCLMFLAMGMAAASCTDDNLYPDRGNGPEGEPAVVTLNVTLPSRSSYTRAALSEADDNRVNSLWVGIYNVATGKFTGGGFMTESNGFTPGQKDHSAYTLSNIQTKSGTSRIVAVANYENHNGVSLDNKDIIRPLKDLLAEADSWDKYRSIIAQGALTADSKNANIQTPNVGDESALLMSGWFVEGESGTIGNHPTDNWQNIGDAAIYIPSGDSKSVISSGAIHLRRLMSHITFNISATGDVVNIEPVSYQVHNAPMYSWVHERTNYGNYGQTEGTIIEATNAGDALSPVYLENNNYKPSLSFTSTDFIKNGTGASTIYSFDFWMMENKRQGLASCDAYSKREAEYGGSIGNLTDPRPTEETNYVPSGVFVSLTDKEVTLNNMATYVDIPCIVTYRNPTTDNDSGATDAEATDVIPSGATRTANVTYRVHLGYTGGQNADPKDFNSYRNSSYTYNVKIQSLKNVVVEAFRKGDNQPGAFGEVTDVTDTYYALDAHYGAFNITLTDDELRNFSFRMISWEDNQSHSFSGGLGSNDYPTDPTDAEYKYYSWIEIMPTTEGTLAEYPGQGSPELLHLADFLPKDDGSPSRTKGTYTIFVNEYVYENSANETTNNWHKYANQPNRNVWLNVAERTSADGMSSYYKAKYAISQKSIQTYYDVTDGSVNTALGLEHVNENIGMNIRWTGNPETDSENGRWNAWTAAGYNNSNRDWSQVVSFTTPQIVNPVNNKTQGLNGDEINLEEKRTWPIPMVSLITSGLSASNDNRAKTAIPSDPQIEGNNIQYYEGYYACMNRNRDLNGNKKIDPEELRWFVPSSGQMLRMILGRNSLSTPIMGYPNRDLPQKVQDGGNTYFHNITSDARIIWTEEGMSSSNFFENNNYSYAPWKVRCVRNLGTNMSEQVKRENRVETAYTTDVDYTNFGGVVEPKYYMPNALRTVSMGPLRIHKTNEEPNRMAMFGFEIAPRGNSFINNNYTTEKTVSSPYSNFVKYSEDNDNNTLCSDLIKQTGKTGWRIPNQKEIIIIYRIKNNENVKLLDANGTTSYFVTTQEYWNVYEPAEPSLIPGIGFRFTTVYDNRASAKELWRMSKIRCVRDLTQAEAGKSYQEILKSHNISKNKRRK